MDKYNITDIKNKIINSDPYFDIKTLFNRTETDSVNRRILYNATPHKKMKGSFTKTNETDRELWPLFESLGWLQQDDINAGDVASSFHHLFNQAIIESPNRDEVSATIKDFDANGDLNDQYELLVDNYAKFDWIKDNLAIFKQYVSLIDTLGNIVVWDRIFNKFRGFDPTILDNFPLSLVNFQTEYYKDDLAGWKTFIDDNQLTMYVDDNYDVLTFSDKPLPETSQAFGEYLAWIVPKMEERNKQILAKLESL